MKLIYVSILLFYVGVRAEEDVKKTKLRDVNDALSADYALSKIPVYVIPNSAALSETKVPVAVIPGAYPPATYYNQDLKESAAKPHKYGFYAPYKTPDVTPIHENQQQEYPDSKYQQDYAITDLNQKSDYNDNPSYKVAVIGKNYQTSQSFVKYENIPKSLPEKHQSLSNGNIYASLAPVLGYSDQSSLGYVSPKKISYDYHQQHQQQQPHQHQPHTQYYIKYIPVPYAVPEDQYQNLPEAAYITPKSIVYKAPKKPSLVPEVQASTPSYAYTNDAYQDTKYAASYAPSQEAYQYPEYKYVQPASYKYYDKNVYAKKYVPTSYLVATLGKEGSTHYAANIQHDEHGYSSKLATPSPYQDSSYPTKLSSSLQEPSYTTKLAPVPLPVDKYVTQQDSSSTLQEDKYSENGYAYVYPNTKYKPLFSVPQYGYDSYAGQHYNKKDVESVSSTKSYESSTSKL